MASSERPLVFNSLTVNTLPSPVAPSSKAANSLVFSSRFNFDISFLTSFTSLDSTAVPTSAALYAAAAHQLSNLLFR
jgi:hypothetical protein